MRQPRPGKNLAIPLQSTPRIRRSVAGSLAVVPCVGVRQKRSLAVSLRTCTTPDLGWSQAGCFRAPLGEWTMCTTQIEALIRRHAVLGLVDAGSVLAIARAWGTSGRAVQKVRRQMGYTHAVNTDIGQCWASEGVLA